MFLAVSDALLDHLGEDGFDPVFGARPLRRIIQNQLEEPLSDSVLLGTYEEGDTISVDYASGEVTFERTAGATATPAEPAINSQHASSKETTADPRSRQPLTHALFCLQK